MMWEASERISRILCQASRGRKRRVAIDKAADKYLAGLGKRNSMEKGLQAEVTEPETRRGWN